jgi:hypothetical protein
MRGGGAPSLTVGALLDRSVSEEPETGLAMRVGTNRAPTVREGATLEFKVQSSDGVKHRQARSETIATA